MLLTWSRHGNTGCLQLVLLCTVTALVAIVNANGTSAEKTGDGSDEQLMSSGGGEFPSGGGDGDEACSADRRTGGKCGGGEAHKSALVPDGYMQPLGSHQAPEPDLAEFDSFVDAEMFYRDVVQNDEPVVFRQVLDMDSVSNLNNDTWLTREFGHVTVTVEEMKKERREGPAIAMTMGDFLGAYNRSEVYLADDVPVDMRMHWRIPAMLLCGGFAERITSIRMWLSSGGTSSVLHTDTVDNLHCLLDGTKHFVMIDRRDAEHIGMDRKQDGSYLMDVDRVDTLQYNMTGVRWWNVTVRPGDCLYIPTLWVHQVRSDGPRNLGVNLWWRPLKFFDDSKCKEMEERFDCRPAGHDGCADGIPASELVMVDDAAHVMATLQSLVDDEGRLYRADVVAAMPQEFHALTSQLAAEFYDELAGPLGNLDYMDAAELSMERLLQAGQTVMKSTHGGGDMSSSPLEQGDDGFEGEIMLEDSVDELEADEGEQLQMERYQDEHQDHDGEETVIMRESAPDEGVLLRDE
eukprot:scpid58046/ scgid16434/ tRNA wybutosine-synthesizing protein 5